MTRVRSSITTAALLLFLEGTVGFSPSFPFINKSILCTNHRKNTRTSLSGAGDGFGASSSSPEEKTFGEDQIRPNDIIDSEGAMSDFFNSNVEWSPLFLSMIDDKSAPAMSFLDGDHGGEIEFQDLSPWKQLEPLPEDESKTAVIAEWLDNVQTSLLDMPVDETVPGQDDLDMNFIEEGKRILAISRFHVLETKSADIKLRDELFMTCWSELAELRRADEADTGSLILLPEYDISDLRRFADMNVMRPLEWLGISGNFEISSFEKGVAAIRILHGLSEIPTDEVLAEREIEAQKAYEESEKETDGLEETDILE